MCKRAGLFKVSVDHKSAVPMFWIFKASIYKHQNDVIDFFLVRLLLTFNNLRSFVTDSVPIYETAQRWFSSDYGSENYFKFKYVKIVGVTVILAFGFPVLFFIFFAKPSIRGRWMCSDSVVFTLSHYSAIANEPT